ncbi:MAG: ATP-binding protein [Candidatus Borkfalkiaceae bacterium]|nr:ATP-binding protein [Christensenellaceae bacterium]
MNRIRRESYLNELINRKENGLIKVITGIRRCGKSYLLFDMYYDYLLSQGVSEQNVVKISLEDDENEELRDSKKLAGYIRDRLKNNADMHYVFIDEVQYAIKKEDLKSNKPLPLYGVLNGLMKEPNVDVYVTGSNSKLLSKDVMTEFRGRGDEVRIYPLTFKEYYDYVGGDKADAFEDYALYGGLPLVLSKKTPRDKAKYLSDLFKEVYFKDIEERYNIAMPEVMEVLTDDLCSSIGSLTNSLKIANTLKSVRNIDVNSQTISAYLNYLEESFLFNEAKRFDVKGKKYFSYPSKFYCTDMGLRNARLNFRQQEETHIMENIIYNELLTRGYSVDVGVVQIAAVGADGKQHQTQCEIDFVVNDGMNKHYIQSALNIDDKNKEKTELRPLLSTRDFFKKVVITKTRMKPWVDDNGIFHIGLYDFLLDKDCLR